MKSSCDLSEWASPWHVSQYTDSGPSWIEYLGLSSLPTWLPESQSQFISFLIANLIFGKQFIKTTCPGLAAKASQFGIIAVLSLNTRKYPSGGFGTSALQYIQTITRSELLGALFHKRTVNDLNESNPSYVTLRRRVPVIVRTKHEVVFAFCILNPRLKNIEQILLEQHRSNVFQVFSAF